MTVATAVKPETEAKEHVWTLEKLVEGARIHGALLYNAGEALRVVQEQAYGRGDEDTVDVELIALIRTRASRASEWFLTPVVSEPLDPGARAAWDKLGGLSFHARLPTLALAAHAAYNDPLGEGSGDLACLGVDPFDAVEDEARELGMLLIEWAEEHGEGTDDA